MLHVHRSRSEQVKRQDFVGMALFVGGLVMFLIGLNWGGIVYPWKSGRVVGTIVAGFITLVIFAGYGDSPPFIVKSLEVADQVVQRYSFRRIRFCPLTCMHI